ncbi:MAG: hypothetical protein ACR2NX_11475 [Chthoniobacterales bacterium]
MIARLSSYMASGDLDLQGVWQWTKAGAPAGSLGEIEANTIAGRSWLQMPWREITLVHPVLQPLAKPAALVPSPAAKNLGKTFATISGDMTTHAASTGKVDLLAAWEDPIDEPALDTIDPPTKTTRQHQTHLCDVLIPEGKNVTAIQDSVSNMNPKHEFGDTKFHQVVYTPVATTRFREYFPTALTDKPENVTLPGDPTTPVLIPNSARPDAPKVLYVVPTYGWEETTAAGSVERKRLGGALRVYLERPWYSSGAGELLGVVFLKDAVFTDLDEPSKAVVTQWGADPIWLSAPAAAAAKTANFKGFTEQADELSLVEISNAVSVVGYTVQYDETRKLWFADLEIDAGKTYAPFVRLALARFQPVSVKGAHLSRVVRADFAQLAPDRIASLTIDSAKVHILVQGITYGASSATIASGNDNALLQGSGRSRRAEIEALLQKRDPSLGTDPHLGWETVSTTLLTPASTKAGQWEGDVPLAAPIASAEFRILLQEYEWYRSDYEAEDARENVTFARRMVYADAVLLS